MCGNRVEELEERVQELQATVDGLTDELVECKVRIRELENIVDDDTGFDPDNEAVEPDPEPEVEPAEEANTEDAESTDEETETDSESDIIIA